MSLINTLHTIEQYIKDVEGEVVFTTSFGPEDQILTYLIYLEKLPISIVTLDTGRLFQETLDTFQNTVSRYDLSIEVLYPEPKQVRQLIVDQKGPNGFYKSIDNRKACCGVRKIAPLTQRLSNAALWITGIRANQSTNRSTTPLFEYDQQFKINKLNPLIDWTHENIWTCIKQHNIPVNSLHKQGYKSIGCAPCTRAIKEHELERAGRWWWEGSHKECGLHR